MNDYRRFLSNAEEYERVAAHTTDPITREGWLKLAKEWRLLAQARLEHLGLKTNEEDR